MLETIENGNGVGNVTVRATDLAGATATSVFQVTVNPVNDAPVTVGAPTVAPVPEDGDDFLVDFTGVFADPDLGNEGDSHELEVTAAAPGGFLISSTTASALDGSIGFIYADDVNGVLNITVTATDFAGATTTSDFEVVIEPAEDAPEVAAPIEDQVIDEDNGPLVVSLEGVFTDIDFEYEGEAWESVTATAAGGGNFIESLVVDGGSVILELVEHEFGNATITVLVTDNEALGVTASDAFEVTVNEVPDDPVVVAAIEDQNLSEDGEIVTIDLSEVFDDPDIHTHGEALTFSIVSATGDGSLFDELVVDGDILRIDLAPDAFDEIGIEVTVAATDTQPASAEDTFRIIVRQVLPIAEDDFITVPEDPTETILIDVLANDNQGDGPAEIIEYGIDAESFSNVTESEWTTVINVTGVEERGPNGSLSLTEDGKIAYEPKENYYGEDYFTYTIRDMDGDVSTATVTITITAVDDPPRVFGTPEYTVDQGGILIKGYEEGLLSWVVDDDGDAIEVQVVTPPNAETYTSYSISEADGSFDFTPQPAYGDDAEEGPITFEVNYWDEDDALLTGPITVTIYVDAEEEEIAQIPPGEVEFDFNLTDVPLEDSIAAEANVLVVMDDSGSMDWGLMTDQANGLMYLSNNAVRDSDVNSYTFAYYYLYPVATNVYGTYWYNLPTEEALADSDDHEGNDYGVWRARNHQFNTIYYNPEIQYTPWIGLNRNGQDFTDADPEAAPLDPFDVNMATIDLTDTYTYVSRRVPIVHYDGAGSRSREDLTNNDVYYPFYYTTPVEGRPAWDDEHTKVEIVEGGSYTGGPDRDDCAEGDDDPMTCTYAQEIQNFANWFTYYRIREYTAKAALGRSVAEASNLRMGYAVLNKTTEREPIDSLNASYRVGHKKDLMDQLYETPSGGGTPLRRALDRAGRHYECVAGDSFGSSSTTEPGDAACPVLASPEGQCQNNYTLLFSDGTWNSSFSGDANADHDANDGPSDSDFDGGMFDGNRAGTLADVAMYYYERDLHPLTDGVPTTERDTSTAEEGSFLNEGEIMHQHMKTYTVGFGVERTIELADLPDDYTEEFAWTDPFEGGQNKIDDMLHAAVNGRGQFLQANNPVLLSQAFQSAFADFSQGSVSVSAVSFNSTSLREDTVLFNGLFNLKNQSGDLLAVPIDIETGEIELDEVEWSAAERLDATDPG